MNLERIFILQQIGRGKNNLPQHNVTIPNEFIKLNGWTKGQKIKLTLILGSGKITLEAVDDGTK